MVTHKGYITQVADGFATISIQPSEAECHGCAISSLCTKAEVVTVPISDADTSLIGREVTIGAPSSLQSKATVLFFVIPIIMLIMAMALSMALGATEAWATVISIVSVVLWYAILYLLRHSIQKTSQFRIIDINSSTKQS